MSIHYGRFQFHSQLAHPAAAHVSILFTRPRCLFFFLNNILFRRFFSCVIAQPAKARCSVLFAVLGKRGRANLPDRQAARVTRRRRRRRRRYSVPVKAELARTICQMRSGSANRFILVTLASRTLATQGTCSRACFVLSLRGPLRLSTLSLSLSRYLVLASVSTRHHRQEFIT